MRLQFFFSKSQNQENTRQWQKKYWQKNKLKRPCKLTFLSSQGQRMCGVFSNTTTNRSASGGEFLTSSPLSSTREDGWLRIGPDLWMSGLAGYHPVQKRWSKKTGSTALHHHPALAFEALAPVSLIHSVSLWEKVRETLLGSQKSHTDVSMLNKRVCPI